MNDLMFRLDEDVQTLRELGGQVVIEKESHAAFASDSSNSTASRTSSGWTSYHRAANCSRPDLRYLRLDCAVDYWRMTSPYCSLNQRTSYHMKMTRILFALPALLFLQASPLMAQIPASELPPAATDTGLDGKCDPQNGIAQLIHDKTAESGAGRGLVREFDGSIIRFGASAFSKRGHFSPLGSTLGAAMI
jgi:hypothetical protein